MTTFEDFSRSNVLAVILQRHNEGGSRDVERLVRMAYEDYINNPFLRHIDSYYLNELRFFPPNLSDSEQQLVKQHQLTDCFVDLGNGDNWCLKTERYVLLKLKRTDKRENHVVASSWWFQDDHREEMIYKYCRNKFREAREEAERMERERRHARKKARKKEKKRDLDLDNIKNNEGISIKIKPGPASKKREIIQRLIQEQAGHSKSPKVVNIPIEIDQDSDSPPPLPLAQIPLRSAAKNTNSPRTTGPAVIDVEQQLSCQDTELEDIKMQLEKRGLLVKPGPISKLKAYLERVKRKEAAIERLPKVKPCPASKKAKYAAKKIQESISAPVAIPSTSAPSPKILPKDVRGSPAWLLYYGEYDPVRKIFYDPEVGPPPLPPPPSALLSVPGGVSAKESPVESPAPASQVNFSPLIVSSPVGPASRVKGKESPQPLICHSQVNEAEEAPAAVADDTTIFDLMEKNAKAVLHPKLFHFPELLGKVKAMLTEKARRYKKEGHSLSGGSLNDAPVIEGARSISLLQGSSMDSVETVIEAKGNTQSAPTTETGSVQATLPPPIDTTTIPEIILCDRLDTQPTSLNTTQPSQNPLQTQFAVVMDSDFEMFEMPELVIEIADENSMTDEILRDGQDSPEEEQKTTTPPLPPPQEESIVVPVQQVETPKRAVVATPRTPVTRSGARSRMNTNSPRGSIQVKVEKGTPRKQVEEEKASPKSAKGTVRGRRRSTRGEGAEKAVAPDKENAWDNEQDGKAAAESSSSTTAKVAYRYNALPLQHKGPAPRKKTAPRMGRGQEKDIHTAVRFGEATEGTAAGLDIQDASLMGSQIAAENDDGKARRSGEGSKVRQLLASLKAIAKQQKQNFGRDAAEEETAPFTAVQVAQLNYKSDGKGNFYTDSCAECLFSATFTVDGVRRLQFHVDINRYLLNLTQAQWEAFQRMLRAVENEFEYSGWGRKRGCGGDEDLTGFRGGGGGGGCVIKRALTCLLETTPKLGVNVGAIRFSTCVGARPVYLKRMPENSRQADLNLTDCLDSRILRGLRQLKIDKRGAGDV